MNASQPSNALVIAGAGASGGYSAAGGAGGGETAQDGFGTATHPGKAGTQVAGGAGGSSATTGEAGTQFQGGSGSASSSAGGGGGWFAGGAAGAAAGNHAGGGGGSSYINAAASVTGTHYAGSGITVPQTSDPDYVAGIGTPATSGHSVGNNGLVVLTYSAGGTTKALNKTSDYEIGHVSDTTVEVKKTSAGSANVKIRLI
jgi:hypothetical protein